MGLNGFSEFIKKKATKDDKELAKTLPFSAFKQEGSSSSSSSTNNKQTPRFSIDASLYLYKYACSDPDNWLSNLLLFAAGLYECGIVPVFVFDGKAPPEKGIEQCNRKDIKSEYSQRILECESLLHAEPTDSVTDLTKGMHHLTVKLVESVSLKSFDKATREDIPSHDLHDALTKLRKNAVTVTPEYHKLLRKGLQLLGLPIVQAPSEAEAMCAALTLSGHTVAALTEDTDILCYGCPVYINKIDLTKRMCNAIYLETVLDILEFNTLEQFVDFAIMIGTDYNSRIPLIGPVKAHKLILQHSNIEEVINNLPKGTNHGILKHERVRELFKLPEIDELDLEIKVPNEEELKTFLYTNMCRVSHETLLKKVTK